MRTGLMYSGRRIWLILAAVLMVAGSCESEPTPIPPGAIDWARESFEVVSYTPDRCKNDCYRGYVLVNEDVTSLEDAVDEAVRALQHHGFDRIRKTPDGTIASASGSGVCVGLQSRDRSISGADPAVVDSRLELFYFTS
jgi:hypothetical protein